VIKAVKGTIIDEFKAFTNDFRAVSLRSLAMAKIAANIKVRLIKKKGIIKGTKATIL
jgi:hypothetical protein